MVIMYFFSQDMAGTFGSCKKEVISNQHLIHLNKSPYRHGLPTKKNVFGINSGVCNAQ